MALEMLGVAAARREGLGLRIGIDTGPVVAGVIGRRKFIYDLWGDTVNTASRMESDGVPGEIQVTERVVGALDGDYVLKYRGTVEIKGKGADVDVVPPRSGRQRPRHSLRRMAPGGKGETRLDVVPISVVDRREPPCTVWG